MEKLKIVIATESYYPNMDGGARAEHYLALSLSQRGHEVYIIAPGIYRKNYEEKDNGTIIYRQKAWPVFFLKGYHSTLFPYNNIKKIIHNIFPDVVHIHNPYGIGISTLKICKDLNIPVVGSNHLLPENLFMFMSKFRFIYNFMKNIGWRALVLFYNNCDTVISPTQTAVNLLQEHGLKTYAKPVSNGIDLSIFTPKYNTQEAREYFHLPQKPIVLYTGRFSGEKRLEVLIHAIPYVLKEVDAHFVLAGFGDEQPHLENLCKKLNVDKNVTFLGILGKDDLVRLYCSASLFAIPSTAELQSIVTMEAMACGLPVVAANKYALPELVHHNENGFLFTPGNFQEMAKYIIQIIKDEELRRRMSEESKKIIQPHDLNKVVVNFEEVYKETIKRKKVLAGRLIGRTPDSGSGS